MKSKYLLLILILICGLLFYSCSTPKTNDLKSKVNNMVSEYNAIDDWEYNLTNGITGEFITIQKNTLWELWSMNRPILYFGRIQETTAYDNLHYLLLIERNTFADFKYLYYPEVRLSLIVPKVKLDTFLEQHPDFYDNYGFNNSIALIADIEKISTKSEIDEDGKNYEILVGQGSMLNVIYIGTDNL